jgi:hypothetical protein
MSALIAIAAEVGAPIVRRILEQKLGSANGGLAADVVDDIARRAGVLPAEIEALAEREPDVVGQAILEVETSPELAQLYEAGLQGQFALLQSEQSEPLWARAWRPLGMYGIGFLWLWNAIILHVANAIWKIALPPMPWEVLLQISGLYMALYMGGHTLKDVARKWTGGAAK